MLPIPAALPGLFARLPAYPASFALTTAFNLAAGRALRDLDWDALEGRRFVIHVRDLGVKAWFSVAAGRLRAAHREQAEVAFTATAMDFIRLGLRLEDPDTLFFNRRLMIEGDTDLGLAVKNMLDAVDLETVLAAMPAPLGGSLRLLRERMS
ncbi:MAG: SCP2 domain-containing protein [Thiotrichales bacterium]